MGPSHRDHAQWGRVGRHQAELHAAARVTAQQQKNSLSQARTRVHSRSFQHEVANGSHSQLLHAQPSSSYILVTQVGMRAPVCSIMHIQWLSPSPPMPIIRSIARSTVHWQRLSPSPPVVCGCCVSSHHHHRLRRIISPSLISPARPFSSKPRSPSPLCGPVSRSLHRDLPRRPRGLRLVGLQCSPMVGGMHEYQVFFSEL